MHEASLVRSLLGQVQAIRVEHQGSAVDEIRIEIGPLAGFEPLLVQTAFSHLVAEFDLIESRLTIDEVALSACCPACGKVEIVHLKFICPICGSSAVQIVSGDEVRLCSVTIRPELEREE